MYRPLESTDTEHAEDSGPQATNDSGEHQIRSIQMTQEWAEVADHIPEIMGVPEDEVLARIEEAVAATKAELMTAHAEQVTELEGTITALKEAHQAECVQIKEQTAADLEAQVKATITQYQELIQQIQNASNRVSEFFEPLSKAVGPYCRAIGPWRIDHRPCCHYTIGPRLSRFDRGSVVDQRACVENAPGRS
jgi:hypothetical protein